MFRLVAIAFAALLLAAPSASAAFGTPVAVTADQAPGAHSPAVAADSPSTAIVAWVRAGDRQVQARRVAADGSTGPVMDLSGAAHASEARSLSATADPSGNVTVVWTRQSDGHVVAVVIAAGGTPGAVIDVSEAMVASSPVNAAAADGLGNVHVVWRKGSDSRVMTRAIAPGGAVGAIEDVSGSDADAALWGTAAGIAADGLGNVYFTWHRNSDCHIMLRRKLAGGGFDPAADVSLTADKAVGDTSPSVAIAGSNALVVWHRDGDINDHADDTVFYSLVTGGVSAGPPTQLSAVGDVSMEAIGVAGAPDGNFEVAWQQRVSKHVFSAPVGASGAAAAQVDHSAGGAVSAADAAPAAAASLNATMFVVFRRDSDGALMLNSSAGNWSPAPPAGQGSLTVSRAIAFRRGKARVRVTCDSTGGAACTGSLKLTARGKRPATYGGARFSVPDGASRTVQVKLSRKARRTIARKGRLKVSVPVKSTVDALPFATSVPAIVRR